jgi:hypothetical protein
MFTRVTRLFLFLLYEQVTQALIHFFGVLSTGLEPSDDIARASLHRRALQNGATLSISVIYCVNTLKIEYLGPGSLWTCDILNLLVGR